MNKLQINQWMGAICLAMVMCVSGNHDGWAETHHLFEEKEKTTPCGARKMVDKPAFSYSTGAKRATAEEAVQNALDNCYSTQAYYITTQEAELEAAKKVCEGVTKENPKGDGKCKFGFKLNSSPCTIVRIFEDNNEDPQINTQWVEGEFVIFFDPYEPRQVDGVEFTEEGEKKENKYSQEVGFVGDAYVAHDYHKYTCSDKGEPEKASSWQR